MAKAKDAAPGRSWSPRSQRSLKHQYELENKIRKFQGVIKYEERLLVLAEQNRKRQAELVTRGQPVYQRNLTDSIAEIRERKDRIAAYEEMIAGLRSEIKTLQPNPSQAAERADKQTKLARLATKRAKKDAEIDAAIGWLRAFLKERAELTAVMLAVAGELDFAIHGDFDSSRFDSLLVGLPSALHPQSARWLSWFLGAEEARRSCQIRREFEIFPETLAAAHFYRHGEEPLLTENQRAQAEAEPPRVPQPGEQEAIMRASKEPKPPLDGNGRLLPGCGIIGP